MARYKTVFVLDGNDWVAYGGQGHISVDVWPLVRLLRDAGFVVTAPEGVKEPGPVERPK